MKHLLLIFLSAFLTAALFSYTLKYNRQEQVVNAIDHAECYPEDVRDISKLEAATREFAALHRDPNYFKLADPKGKKVSFTTLDGQAASAYEIKNVKKTDNYLLVIHEWYGLNDYIKQESDLLSAELPNVNVLALDLYDGKVATTADSAMKYMSGVNNDRLENIIKGAINYAGRNAKIYTIGWCFGGMWSLQSAILAGKQGAGCVMYYGRPETNVEKLKQLNTDVIGFFGNQDKSITPEKVTEFENNMKTAGKTISVNRYEAGHGFANPSNPSFNKDAREDAHTKTIAYLKARMQ